MEIKQLMELLYSKRVEVEVLMTSHSKERMASRNISEEDVREVFNHPEKILGILKQNENKFKIYYPYTQNKDLVVIVTVSPGKDILYIRVITTFVQEAKRRLR